MGNAQAKLPSGELSVSQFRDLADLYERHKRHKSDGELVKMLAELAERQEQVQLCVAAMKDSELFSMCRRDKLEELAKEMTLVKYRRGSVIIHQGEPHDKMLIVAQGKDRDRFYYPFLSVTSTHELGRSYLG